MWEKDFLSNVNIPDDIDWWTPLSDKKENLNYFDSK